MGTGPLRAQNYTSIARGSRNANAGRFRTDGNLAYLEELREHRQPSPKPLVKADPKQRSGKKLYTGTIEQTATGKTAPAGKNRIRNAAPARRAGAPLTKNAVPAVAQGASKNVRQHSARAAQYANAPKRPGAERTVVNRDVQDRPKREQKKDYSYVARGARVSAAGEMAIPLQQAHTQRSRAESPVAHTAPRPAGVVSTILLVVFVFGMLSFLLMRNAAISDVSLKNAEIQKSITSLSQELDKLKLSATLKADLNSVQERAAQLSMGTPGSGQIIYLTRDQSAEMKRTDTLLADTQKPGSDSFDPNSLFKEIKSWFG